MDPDDDFAAYLRATFRAEAVEHVEAITAALLAMEASQEPQVRADHIDEMRRVTHSLKGAAGAAAAEDVRRISGAIESVLDGWRRSSDPPDQASIDSMSDSLDSILRLLDHHGDEPTTASEPTTSVDDAAAGQRQTVPAPPSPAPTGPSPTPRPAAPSRDVTVRIHEDRVNEILLATEELINVKIATEHHAVAARELANEVAALRKSLTNARSVTTDPGGISTRDETVADLMHRVSEQVGEVSRLALDLADQTAQNRRTIDPQVDELLSRASHLVMLPFTSIAGLFPKAVRDTARREGKEAQVIVRGGDTELDRRILEELKDPLLHAIRNAVSHGIETPADRRRVGKEPMGTVMVEVTRVDGGRVSVSVADDGRGLDTGGLREAARNAGLGDVTDGGDPAELAFAIGVTTSAKVTEISGRGVGLNVVRKNVSRLEGTVTLDSEPGRGTALRIVVPTTRATIHGVLVEVQARPYVIPTSQVSAVFRVTSDAIQHEAEWPTIVLGDDVVPIRELSSVLGLGTSARQDVKHLQGVVIGSTDDRVALIVDRVLSEQSILVKQLGPQLRSVDAVAGATVLADGRVAPVLEPRGLLTRARLLGSGVTASKLPSGAESAVEHRPMVLVVEDSVTSRMVLRNILLNAGYDVRVAVDGADAMVVLATEPFDAVVSDIEMPNMNGFELTAAIRADEALAELPVILVTSLESDEDRARGMDAGASAYLGKNAFDQGKLLDRLRGLIR